MLLWKWDLLEAECHDARKYFGFRPLKDLPYRLLPKFSFALSAWTLTSVQLVSTWILLYCQGGLWRCDLVLMAYAEDVASAWLWHCHLLFSFCNPKYVLYLHTCVCGSLLTLEEIRTELSEGPLWCCSAHQPLQAQRQRTDIWFLWAPKWSLHFWCFGADILILNTNPRAALQG